MFKYKTSKIPTKVDDGTKYSVVGLKNNYQEPGGINKNTDVTYDQEPKVNFTNTNWTDTDTDAEMGLNNDAILKQINGINGT